MAVHNSNVSIQQQQALQHQNGAGDLANGYAHEGLPSHNGLVSNSTAQPYQYEPMQQPQQQIQQQQIQIPQQQIPQQNYDSSSSGAKTEPLQTITGSGDGQKGNRLRKACDSCSIRKVKCDESGPPCRACAALDIPCTFERPSRRRGPPNRHAEAIKRRRLEVDNGFPSSPSSPTNIAATLASFSSHAVLNAESICPYSTLELLVDDFFTYIHPLVPFPHEPSFRAAFKHREDLNNPSFLALLASMVGALVASFPRKPRLHLKAQSREKLFPNSVSLVERCHKVAVEARGAGYLDKDLTVYDAATSYFMGLAACYTFNWTKARLCFAETLTISRSLGVHKAKDQGFYHVGSMPTAVGSDETGYVGKAQDGPDFIKQEIGRRIFWVAFVGVRSMQQMGASFPELTFPPPTRSDPYPPLPMEVDDEFIFVSHVDPQPQGVTSRVIGFNLGVKTYLAITPVATMELAYGTDELFDWPRQKRILEGCLHNVKRTLDMAPRELLLNPGSADANFVSDRRQYFPPAQDPPGVRMSQGQTVQTKEEEDRRYLQFEIQKANIFASHLATRSWLVEKYWNMYEVYEKMNGPSSTYEQTSPGLAGSGLDGLIIGMQSGSNVLNDSHGSNGAAAPNPDAIESQMISERETIVKDLLRVLGSISQVNMEPNGGSFINKIRQIASTLLDTPRNRKSPLALRAEEYLGRFLDVLMKLERISPGRSRGAEDWEEDEEEELRNWADLREFQTKFMDGGGFES